MTCLYSGRVISLHLDDVILPNGQAARLERIEHPGGAAVVALNDAGDVCLLSQYRHVAKTRVMELPAGKLTHGDPLLTAQTELLEEAGLTATRWQALGVIYSSPGVFTEIIHLYLAQGLTLTANSPEPDEDIEVCWWPLSQALAAAKDGTLVDAKTIIGLMRAEALLTRQGR